MSLCRSKSSFLLFHYSDYGFHLTEGAAGDYLAGCLFLDLGCDKLANVLRCSVYLEDLTKGKACRLKCLCLTVCLRSDIVGKGVFFEGLNVALGSCFPIALLLFTAGNTYLFWFDSERNAK